MMARIAILISLATIGLCGASMYYARRTWKTMRRSEQARRALRESADRPSKR